MDMGERAEKFEEMMAGFAEIRASLTETRIGLSEIRAGMEKTEKQMAENAKNAAENDKKFAEMREELGNIGHNNGLVAEEIVYHSLNKNMTFAGIEFDFIDHGTVRTRKLSDGKKVKGEYDVLLYNGTSVAIIEVKHRVGRDALKRLIEVQMPRFRQIFPEYKDCKMYLGLGGMSFEKDIAEEAQSLGIATLTLSGDAVEINDKNVKAW